MPNTTLTATYYKSLFYLSGVDNTWASLRAQATASAAQATEGRAFIYARPTIDKYDSLWRMPRIFTTALPAYASITAATFKLYVDDKFSGWPAGRGDLCVVAFTPSSYSEIVTSDFNVTRWGSTVLGYTAHSSITSDQYNDITLNASGIAAIPLATAFGLGVMLRGDVENNPYHPGSLTVYGVECQQSTYISQLYIEYTYLDAAAFRYRKSGATCKVCTTATDPGGSRMMIRKSGATYYMPLVATDHVDASSFRVRIGGETKAGILVL